MIDFVKKQLKKHRQFILFCIVGGMNTLITMFVFWLLNSVLHINHLIASPIGYACGVVNGYLWSTALVFRQKKTAGNALKFILVNAFVMGVNTALMYLWVNVLGMVELLAQGVTILFTMVLNFTLNKLWTFREKKVEKAEKETPDSIH